MFLSQLGHDCGRFLEHFGGVEYGGEEFGRKGVWVWESMGERMVRGWVEAWVSGVWWRREGNGVAKEVWLLLG